MTTVRLTAEVNQDKEKDEDEDEGEDEDNRKEGCAGKISQ